MGDELAFQARDLHASGQDLQDAGQRLSDHWTAMQGTVQGMGDIFGDDTVGSLIATTYGTAHQIAHEAYTSSARGFSDFGDGIKAMAGDFDGTEQKNAQEATDVGRSV